MSPSTAGRGEMPSRHAPWRPDDDLASSGRDIIGYVYEVFTATPALDSDHPYVGKTEGTVHQRVHGRSGHTSPRSVAKDPWKARILAGPAGYRILERVRDTGEGDLANDAAMRRAEAFWIDRIRPKHNGVRPVRPPAHEGPGPKRAAVQHRRAVVTPAQRRARRRLAGFAVLAGAWTYIFVRLVLAMNLPWAVAPWVAGPTLGVFLGWLSFMSIDGWLAVLTGRRAPYRRRRRR